MSPLPQRIGRLAFPGILILAILCLLCVVLRPAAPRRRGIDAAFAPQVYIWQRNWSPDVRDAAAAEIRSFARTVVLSRQIAWDHEQPAIVRVGVDWQALKSAGIEVAAALRINPYSGRFDAQSPAIAQCVRSIVDEAAAAGVKLSEVQIDFDAATARLGDFRQWLSAARTAAAPVPVTFTALPAWLSSRDLAPLARDARYFVLQVHWLDRPKRISDPLPLCDIPAAQRDLEKAGGLGVPFRIALPTYSYVAAFNTDGSFAGLAAEDAPPDWGEGKTLRLISARPDELAQFVNQLAADRPMTMLGVIWYRLPIASDRLNWPWQTLEAVMNGKIPAPGKLTVDCPAAADGALDIILSNNGEQDASTDATITLMWPGAPLVAADALAGFRILDRESNAIRIVGSSGWQNRIRPGQSEIAGWLRLGKEASIHGTVEQN